MKLANLFFHIIFFILFVIFCGSCQKMRIDNLYGEVFIIDKSGVYPFQDQKVRLKQMKDKGIIVETTHTTLLETTFTRKDGSFDFGSQKISSAKRTSNYVCVPFPTNGKHIPGRCEYGVMVDYQPFRPDENIGLYVSKTPSAQHFVFRFHKAGVLKLVLNKPDITSNSDTTWISITPYDEHYTISKLVTGKLDYRRPSKCIFFYETLADDNVVVKITRSVNSLKTYQFDTISIPWNDTLSYTYNF